MTFLPVLLAPVDTKTDNANTEQKEDTGSDIDTSGIIEMWTMPTTQAIEVNGADFY